MTDPQGWKTYELGSGRFEGRALVFPLAPLGHEPGRDSLGCIPNTSTLRLTEGTTPPPALLHPAGSPSGKQTLINQDKARGTLRMVRMGAVGL